MASNALKKPILRVASVRTFAAQAATHPSPGSPKEGVKTTVLPNKLVVASLENYSPISRVSVLFRAGSRNETWDNYGSTHVLRIATGLSTKNSTHFGIVRNIQQVGGSLSVQADREVVMYTLEANRDALEDTLKYLEDVATKQAFKPWELSDNLPRLKYELASIPDPVRALDLLHTAAYRTGLGNSIFCPPHLVGKLSSETLQHYVKCYFTTNRTAVVGVGVSHDTVLPFAQSLGLESGEGPQSSGTYHGGELRHNNTSGLAHVAVAAEGVSLKDSKQVLAASVLQYALGVGPSVKWGNPAGSLLQKAAASAAGSDPFAVNALNVSFTDSGLFGFIASAPANVIGVVVKAAVQTLRGGSVSADDVNRAKKQLKAAVLMSEESGDNLLESIGYQALLRGDVHTGQQLAATIDSISPADVTAVAKKIANGKLSMGAAGQLHCVPYVDELK
ncbi:cytochrome b-c1 complex subunit 2, mitochondrial [Schistocerca americana]|uniref:cytochrome b-c1 complex subunit 2, mitochondrial n=1 Tax=Schistocerca americana TaxID=7009 RepID=UPI001F4FC844|nr:cytochrome b-c1 complex subunit 2, mitochondrial [Schistocerca americana]